MIGVVIGIVLLGVGGFLYGKKKKGIGLTCIIIGGAIFGVSLVVAGII